MRLRDRLAGKIWLIPLMMVAVFFGYALGKIYTDGATLEAGDWMTFVGAVIGSAVTVAGAVFLTEYQRLQGRHAARNVMAQLLSDVLEFAHRVRTPTAIGDVEDYVPAVMQVTNADLLQEKIDTVKLARTWFTPETPGMVRAFAQIDKLDVDREAIRHHLRPSIKSGRVGDIEHLLTEVESRARVALAELNV